MGTIFKQRRPPKFYQRICFSLLTVRNWLTWFALRIKACLTHSAAERLNSTIGEKLNILFFTYTRKLWGDGFLENECEIILRRVSVISCVGYESFLCREIWSFCSTIATLGSKFVFKEIHSNYSTVPLLLSSLPMSHSLIQFQLLLPQLVQHAQQQHSGISICSQML